MNAKIFDFPKQAIVRPPLEADVQKRIRENRKGFYDMVSMQEASELLAAFHAAGVNIRDPIFAKRFSLGMEFIRSALYGSINENHPLQVTADHMTQKLGIDTPSFEPDQDMDLDNNPE